MSNLLDKTEFTQQDILDIISSRTEESINIDFKDARSLSSGDGKEIAKDVSAFANSDGGLIFYGINEDNHVATDLSFVDGNKYNKEWLENKITSNIQQRIHDILIIPVRFDNDINRTIYVVKIPKSLNTPHINSFDNKYYRRFNFKSVPMEEYEVRDSYFRANGSKVIIEKSTVTLEESINKDSFNFNIEVHASNIGTFIAEKYRISCNIKDFKSALIKCKDSYLTTYKFDDGYKISTKDTPPIFPNEVLNILSFNLEISKKDYLDFITSIQINFYTYNVGSFEDESQPKLVKLMKDLVRDLDAKFYQSRHPDEKG